MREAIIRLNNKKDDAELCIKQNEKITFKMLSKEELVKLFNDFFIKDQHEKANIKLFSENTISSCPFLIQKLSVIHPTPKGVGFSRIHFLFCFLRFFWFSLPFLHFLHFLAFSTLYTTSLFSRFILNHLIPNVQRTQDCNRITDNSPSFSGSQSSLPLSFFLFTNKFHR